MKAADALRHAARMVRDRLRKKGEIVMLSVGDAAPDFEVRDHRGKTLKLSDQSDKWIVLWFYPKADTPG